MTEKEEKDQLLNQFIEQIAPGRCAEIRLSNDRELSATMVVKLSLDEASVKVSNGNVSDDAPDLSLPVWAGIVPFRTQVGPLISDPQLSEEITKPDYRQAYGHLWCDELAENDGS